MTPLLSTTRPVPHIRPPCMTSLSPSSAASLANLWPTVERAPGWLPDSWASGEHRSWPSTLTSACWLRAVRRTPRLRALVADAGAIPMRTSSLDITCFAQSWHWVDQGTSAVEAARVLRPSGLWAAWWNQPWADDEPWFDRYYSVLEERAGISREQRNTDWCQEAISALTEFAVPERYVLAWERWLEVGEWIVDQRSHSYVVALSEPERRRLLTDLEAILWSRFRDGRMTVPYQTRAWVARRR
jgi:hypothetical protein